MKQVDSRELKVESKSEQQIPHTATMRPVRNDKWRWWRTLELVEWPRAQGKSNVLLVPVLAVSGETASRY
jgi:hypothetical protein